MKKTSHDTWPWMLTGWIRFRIPSRVPFSIDTILTSSELRSGRSVSCSPPVPQFSNGSRSPGTRSPSAHRLCTLTPSSRTGRVRRSVRSSNCTARCDDSPLRRASARRVWLRVIVVKSAVADLDRDRSRQQRPARQPGGGLRRHLARSPRASLPDRSGPRRRCSPSPTTSPRGWARPAGRRCRAPAAAASRRGCRPPRGARADRPCARRPAVRCRVPAACGRSPGRRPTSASTGSCCRNGSTRSGLITVRPSGFFQPDAIFARNLFGATPADAVRPVSARMRSFSRRATVVAERLVPGVLGDVEVGLVERQRLDERRHLAEDREHRVRRRLVAGEVRAAR